MNRRRASYLFWFLITAFAIFGLVWGILDPQRFGRYQDIARQFIAPLGVWGAVLFIVIQALQVVFTPISHYTVGALGGFLYGPYLGGALNYIGRILGHIAAFFIAHKLRRWALKWVGEETMARYDRIFAGTQGAQRFTVQHLVLFLFYFLPLFPDDEISYLVGLSRMAWTPFLLANIFGHLGGAFSLSYIGSGIDTKDMLFWILTIVTLVGFVGLWVAFFFLSRKRKQGKSA